RRTMNLNRLCGPLPSRRNILASGVSGVLSSLALGDLLAADGPHSVRPHFTPRAKNVIYLHMIGAPSHLDLFDYKPELVKRDNQVCPDELTKGKRFAFLGGKLTLGGTRFRFARHGR